MSMTSAIHSGSKSGEPFKRKFSVLMFLLREGCWQILQFSVSFAARGTPNTSPGFNLQLTLHAHKRVGYGQEQMLPRRYAWELENCET